jgi:hypothetical protein
MIVIPLFSVFSVVFAAAYSTPFNDEYHSLREDFYAEEAIQQVIPLPFIPQKKNDLRYTSAEYRPVKAKVAFSFEIPTTKQQEIREKLFGRYMKCVMNGTQNLAEFVRQYKEFGKYDLATKRFQGLADIFKETVANIDLFKRFTSYMIAMLGHSEELVANVQVIGQRLLIGLLRYLSQIYNARIHEHFKKYDSDNDLIRHVLIAAPLIFKKELDTDDKILLKNSTDYFVNFMLEYFSDLEWREEIVNATKNIVKITIPAVIKRLRGEEMNDEERRELMNVYIKLFIHLNNGANATLLHFANQFLSNNYAQTNKEFFGLLLRNILEKALREMENQSKKIEVKYFACLTEVFKETLCIVYTILPVPQDHEGDNVCVE